MAKLTKKQRQDIEALILEVFYTIDKSNTNTDHYKKLFAKMTDDQFYKFISAKIKFSNRNNYDMFFHLQERHLHHNMCFHNESIHHL